MNASPYRTIGIDWGTTHRRAYLLDGSGALLATQHDDQGLLAARGDFPGALQSLLAPWKDLLAGAAITILMAGMVGSAQGWREVPYLAGTLPASADLHRFDDAACAGGSRMYIVPGCLWRSPGGAPDVMRGEETQLLGARQLGHGDGWYVLPGTHSKWTRLEGGRITQLRTYMTGELFALLRQQGTLAALIQSDDANAFDAAAFARGVAASRDAALGHALFSARAQVVGGDCPAAGSASYVSGLLIGAEWHDILRMAASDDLAVKLVGSPTLAHRHAQAAELLGRRVDTIDPEQAFVAALRYLTPAWPV